MPDKGEPVVVVGGPCGNCGATVAHNRWRSGKKGTEHEGKPCCHVKACKVALGIEKVETPTSRRERREKAKEKKAAATAEAAQPPPQLELGKFPAPLTQTPRSPPCGSQP